MTQRLLNTEVNFEIQKATKEFQNGSIDLSLYILKLSNLIKIKDLVRPATKDMIIKEIKKLKEEYKKGEMKKETYDFMFEGLNEELKIVQK